MISLMKKQNMLREIFFLVTVNLSLQVLQNQNKIIVRDIQGLQGINNSWEKVNTCDADYWYWQMMKFQPVIKMAMMI